MCALSLRQVEDPRGIRTPMWYLHAHEVFEHLCGRSKSQKPRAAHRHADQSRTWKRRACEAIEPLEGGSVTNVCTEAKALAHRLASCVRKTRCVELRGVVVDFCDGEKRGWVGGGEGWLYAGLHAC